MPEIILSLTELIEKLNKGGWFVRSGCYMSEEPLPLIPIVKAGGARNIVTIEVTDHSFRVSCDKIVQTNPGLIEIRSASIPEKLQKGKPIKGLWVALRLTNPAAEKAFVKECKEKQRQLEEERQQREAERKQKIIKEVKAKVIGKKVIELCFVGGADDKLLFKFEGEESLTIDMEHDYNDAWIRVDGFSLRDLV